MKKLLAGILVLMCINVFGQVDADSSHYYIYGKGCGRAGKDPAYRVKLTGIVDKKDTLELKSWLYSERKSLNAYAVEGYYRLKKDGYIILEPIADRIKKVRSDNTVIETCWGCMYSDEKLKIAIKERLRFFGLE